MTHTDLVRRQKSDKIVIGTSVLKDDPEREIRPYPPVPAMRGFPSAAPRL